MAIWPEDPVDAQSYRMRGVKGTTPAQGRRVGSCLYSHWPKSALEDWRNSEGIVKIGDATFFPFLFHPEYKPIGWCYPYPGKIFPS